MSNSSQFSYKDFEELKGSVNVVSSNLDQFFLIVMGCLIFCKYDMLRILIISVSCHKFDKTFRKTQSTIFKIIHCCIAKLHDIPCSPVYTSKLNLQYLSITVSYN